MTFLKSNFRYNNNNNKQRGRGGEKMSFAKQSPSPFDTTKKAHTQMKNKFSLYKKLKKK